mgnify:FL=1
MNRNNQMYLGDHCKVAMAECIPDNEENKFVYHMSEEVHRVLTEQQQKYPNFSVVHKKIDSVKSRMGKIRAVEFQLERCVGRLRGNYVYSDTVIDIQYKQNGSQFFDSLLG